MTEYMHPAQVNQNISAKSAFSSDMRVALLNPPHMPEQLFLLPFSNLKQSELGKLKKGTTQRKIDHSLLDFMYISFSRNYHASMGGYSSPPGRA